MSDLNTPDDATRKRQPGAPAATPRAPAAATTGDWSPADGAPVQLAVPARVGRFEVRSVLGVGTYGRVFLAFDPEMGRLVAIKQPFGEGLRPEYRADFLKEARAAAVIDQHANVCPVYNVDSDDGLPYIVMRFVAGGTLKGLLERRAPLPVRTALVVARKIALGLTAAHAKGVIHRDLKPGNVLIDDANREVLITDFGLARVTTRAAAAASMARGAHGTPFYMPPEQWGSKAFGEITPLADVYSLGVILYEMLAGRVPFDGAPFELMTKHCTEAPRPPSAVRAGLDPVLDAIVLRAMAKQQRDRFRSAQEMADALNDYLRGADVELVEDLPLGEPIEESPAAPVPPDYADWLKQQGQGTPPRSGPPVPKRPAGGGPAASTSTPDATLDEKEVIRCPKCRARLEIGAGRTKPVDCPLCALKFTVAAGRQAAARAAGPVLEPEFEPEPEREVEPERTPSGRSRRPRGERRDPREDEDDRPPRRHWRPAASGLWLALVGTLVTGFFVACLGVAWLVAIGEESPSKSSTSSKGGYSETSSSRSSAHESEVSVSPVVFAVLGLGVATGLLVTGIGRYRAGRLPRGLAGGGAALLSAVAQWGAALAAAGAAVLIPWLAHDSDGSRRSENVALGAGLCAAGFALVLLLASDFAFTSYLAAVGRHLGRRFPQGLTTVAKVTLWVMLSCVVIGGAAGGMAAALSESGGKTPPGVIFFGVLAGAGGCLAVAVTPFWGAVMLILDLRAALAVGRYARDED